MWLAYGKAKSILWDVYCYESTRAANTAALPQRPAGVFSGLLEPTRTDHMDMATNLRLKELAAVVQSHLSKITSPGPEIEPKNVGSTNAVLEAVDELQLLLRGPVPYLMEMAIHQARGLRLTSPLPQCFDKSSSHLQAIYGFNIPGFVPIDEATSFAKIPKICGQCESDIKRILRHAMTYYIFREPVEGSIAHTPVS